MPCFPSRQDETDGRFAPPGWRCAVLACISRAMSHAKPPRSGPSGTPDDGPGPRRGLVLAGESSLRRRLIARDEQALVELIELASPWLLGVTQAMLSDSDEAEEVVLE